LLSSIFSSRKNRSRFKVQGSRFKVQGSRFKVQGSRFKVQGSRFKVQGSRFKEKCDHIASAVKGLLLTLIVEL
jgi:hypothetical protein